ncbi:hypothetical protein TWF225_011049 [Orbilia oligospora]|uniref:Uncharacterized protein n=1 Tax=Orbilia oligospora TaxID=2813651 RepID=A0A7C8P6K7_ORBOL|nr:hypothetical protein TWF751_009750 [Orbilia oligospora]KAF3193217.1 hypothetical protein TWF225_011049 [Orbilia oligospora]KAF3246566.1 hypothetical protein TWF217_009902 [Orbilia oligospora]KAF3271687.1 hypothetical protein TWF128_000240 [Orbilia oligospora]TGJ72561.1 hypothetical protein EYR41_004447 [Orbilia oligospora]
MCHFYLPHCFCLPVERFLCGIFGTDTQYRYPEVLLPTMIQSDAFVSFSLEIPITSFFLIPSGMNLATTAGTRILVYTELKGWNRYMMHDFALLINLLVHNLDSSPRA